MAFLEQGCVYGEVVVDGRRVAGVRSQPIVGDHGLGVQTAGVAAHQPSVSARRSGQVSAAMQIEQRAAGNCFDWSRSRHWNAARLTILVGHAVRCGEARREPVGVCRARVREVVETSFLQGVQGSSELFDPGLHQRFQFWRAGGVRGLRHSISLPTETGGGTGGSRRPRPGSIAVHPDTSWIHTQCHVSLS